MAVLPIYVDGSPVLRKKAKQVKNLTNDIIGLIMDMFETMRKANGIGLAANQVGQLLRVIVVDLSEVEGMENFKPMALINPEVLEQKGKKMMEEGCLSVPELRGEVERAEEIKLRYKDNDFKDIELEANGLLARVILHEIDHLDGVLFIDHLSAEEKQANAEMLKKIRTGEIEVSYPVVTASDVLM